jgi:hypothetical protein
VARFCEIIIPAKNLLECALRVHRVFERVAPEVEYQGMGSFRTLDRVFPLVLWRISFVVDVDDHLVGLLGREHISTLLPVAAFLPESKVLFSIGAVRVACTGGVG